MSSTLDDRAATRLEDLFRALHRDAAAMAGPEGLLHEDLARLALSRAPHLPPSVARAATDPANRLDEFLLVEQAGASRAWKAWDQLLGRWVAVKFVDGPAARPDLPVLPGLVLPIRAGECAGRHYLVLPWIEGGTLDRVRLQPRAALEALRTAALAIHALHRHGLGHGAIRPGNLMIDRHGAAIVLNASLATADVAADVAALGATLRELDPHADAAILRMATHADPSRRYRSAADFAADLDRALAGRSPLAPRPLPWRPILAAAAALAVALLALWLLRR
jgi:hypothetical protein